MLIQSLHHIKYLIDPRDLVMAPQLIVYRQWEPDLTALLWNLLAPRSVFVDVGANFGYFTCLAATRIGAGGSGRVFAVEPNPALVALLRANSVINWSMCPIAISAVAAAAAAGQAKLSIPADGAANATLSVSEDDPTTGAIIVDLAPLDDLIPVGMAVDVMKIDVEGHELGALLGARRVLAASPNIKVIMEWSAAQMATAGCAREDMLAFLDDLGMSIYEAPADGRVGDWTRLTRERLLGLDYGNIILARAG